MNNLWCTNYSSVRTNTRFTVCHLNLSDHVEVTLHTSFSYKMDRSEHDQMNKMALEMQIKHKINWKKCDRQYYCDLLENGLAPLYQQIPNSQFEMDLMVTTVTQQNTIRGIRGCNPSA